MTSDDDKPRGFATQAEALAAVREREKRREVNARIASRKNNRRTVVVQRRSPAMQRGRGR